MDELLDLVNENDEVIGEVWRSEAHQNPKLIHREAAVILYSKEGILLQKRSLLKKSDPGMWTITRAGHVPKGVSPEETAHIELTEELGFDTGLKFFMKRFTKRDNEARFTHCYCGEYSGQKIVLQKEEVEEIRLCSKEEIEELIKNNLLTKGSEWWIRTFWGDELLDLVNKNDEVIGEVWRSETVGNLNLIYREVGVLINDNKNRLLLQKLSSDKKMYGGYWIISASGHVGKGENPELAAHRELKEEMGFDTLLRFSFKQLMTTEESQSIAYAYTGEYNDTEIIIQKDEVEEAKFFTKEEFLELEKNDKVEPVSGQWCREFWKESNE